MDLATSVRFNGLVCPHCGARSRDDCGHGNRILEWTRYALICELSCWRCPGRWRVTLFASAVDLSPQGGLSIGDDDAAELARLRAEVARLTRERDALIASCISPPGHAGDSLGAFWIVKGEVLCRTEAEAIAAVRQSAGLAGEG